MTILYVGVDLAKNVFAVHGVDGAGKPARVKPCVRRAELMELVAKLAPCVIGMEACSGAHHGAREFTKFGHTVRRQAAEHLEGLPQWANTAAGDALSEVHRLDERLDDYDRYVSLMAAADERSRRLMSLRGIGATTASALLAAIGNGHDFSNGRQLAAWLGLVPGQYSSGGKTRLGRI